ncbi:MAG: hypothetical protein JWM43_2058 [Acidobacteriaceae bacterium]|nr:hypothetical protein [Acidobacteriaceae bacterium]
MNNRGLLKFRLVVITLLGVGCTLAAATSHFVHPTQTPQAALITNALIGLFGIACFVQAYVLQRELGTS